MTVRQTLLVCALALSLYLLPLGALHAAAHLGWYAQPATTSQSTRLGAARRKPGRRAPLPPLQTPEQILGELDALADLGRALVDGLTGDKYDQALTMVARLERVADHFEVLHKLNGVDAE